MIVDRKSKKVGLVASCFDVGPHAGHMAMLEEAKKHCDHLIVALHVDPSVERPGKRKPVPTLSERYICLSGCKYVDEIIPYETEIELFTLLKIIQPDVRILGDDYKGRNDFTGSNLDINIYYVNRDHGISSSRLRETIKGDSNGRT